MYAQDKRADDNDEDSRIHELQAKIEYVQLSISGRP